MVFEGVDAEVAKVEKLIAELDRPAREVVIRAYVFEVGSTVSDGSAVSLALNLLGGRLTGSTPAANLAYSVGLSSFVATTGVNSSPTLLKRDLTTNFGLKSGEVALIDGLEEFRGSDARSGLPGFLSFLSSRSRDESRSELILLLEASVVEAQ